MTSVEELARLRKATAYISGLMESLDPELVPPQIWDAFSEQAQGLLNQVVAFNSDKDVGRLKQANAHADNLLTYVRPYQVVTGRVAKSLRDAAIAYSAVMREQLEQFSDGAIETKKSLDALAGKASEKAADVGLAFSQILEAKDEILGDGEEGGIRDDVLNASEELKKKAEEINALHVDFLVGLDGKPSLKSSILELADAVKGDRKRIADLLKSSVDSIEELEGFHARIFGEADDDGQRNGGLSGELDDQLSRLTEFEKEHRKQYVAWNNEIKGLLPSATSAGLAFAYKEMKDSFNSPIKIANSVFYGAITLLVLASLFLLVEEFRWGEGFKLVTHKNWIEALQGFVQRLPFYVPVVWLAYFASKRRSEYQRLQQEYAHKEAIASSYESFKRQVEAIGEDGAQLSKVLLERAIEAIAHNASSSLDGKHGDKMPASEALDRLAEKLIMGLRP